MGKCKRDIRGKLIYLVGMFEVRDHLEGAPISFIVKNNKGKLLNTSNRE